MERSRNLRGLAGLLLALAMSSSPARAFWQRDGVQLVDHLLSYKTYRMVTGSGGTIVVWVTDGFPTRTINARAVTPAGAQGWPADAILLSDSYDPPLEDLSDAESDGSGGALVAV